MINPRQLRCALGVLLVLPVFTTACSKDTSAKEDTAIPEVTVAVAHREPLAENLRIGGSLATPPNRDAKISALVPGRIHSVLVNEGDAVKADQPLALLENPSLQEQLRQAEAAVAQAQANLENARISAQRNEDLLRRGIAARKEVEDAHTLLSVNESLLKQAEAARSAAQTQIARSTLRAPFAGTVVHRFLGTGEQVDGTSAQPIIEVADVSTLELQGQVPGSRLSEIRTGTDFQFQTTEVPDQTFHAQVTAVLPSVDPATGNGTVRIQIRNPGRLLKLGMFVSLELPLREPARGLVVPRQAIYPDESGEPHVYKLTTEEAEFVPVTLGTQTADKVQVLSGLNEGDRIILAGGYGLPDKSKVRVKP